MQSFFVFIAVLDIQAFIAATSMTAWGLIDPAEGAGNDDVAVFHRLPHDLEHVAPEFRRFVKEQDTVIAPIGLNNHRRTKTDPAIEEADATD